MAHTRATPEGRYENAVQQITAEGLDCWAAMAESIDEVNNAPSFVVVAGKTIYKDDLFVFRRYFHCSVLLKNIRIFALLQWNVQLHNKKVKIN